VRKSHRHRMHGTILLLANDRSLAVNVDAWRARGLIVQHYADSAEALRELDDVAPDVIVALLTAHESAAVVRELRNVVDRATSIIVASDPEQRDTVRQHGADSFLLNSAPASELLYEIHRALILRRSGRRLPWNW
jgi:DNA-binding NarL/FixJ family response regulator